MVLFEGVEMSKPKSYQCDVCGYIYDPQRGEPNNGILPGTAFEDLPSSYVCPVCGARAKVGKTAFSAMEAESGRYRCLACGYLYDPSRGEPKQKIAPGTAFEDLPDTYICPVCGVYAKIGKGAFVASE
jgi:rubredoxin